MAVYNPNSSGSGGTTNYNSLTNLPRFIPRGVKVAIYGDSITNQNNSTGGSAGTPTSLTNETSGYFNMCDFMLGRPFYFPVATTDGVGFSSANYGVSGDTSTQALARLSTVQAFNPDICFILIGTNDANSSISVATTTSNIDSMITGLTNQGCLVVIYCLIPRAASSFTSAATAKAQQMAINNFIRNYPKNTGNQKVLVVDPTRWMVDATSSVGDPLAIMVRPDGIHPTPTGAYYMGREAATVLSNYFSYGINQFAAQEDVWDATNNTKGSLITNGLLQGTGGTAGTGAAGSVATSWTAQQATGTGMTAVLSKGTTAVDFAQGTSQIIAFTCNGAGAGEEDFDFRVSSSVVSGFSAGDTLVAGCDYRVTNPTGTWLGFGLQLEVTASTNYTVTDMDRYDTTAPMANITMTGRCRTPPLVVPTSPTALVVRFRARYNNTIAGSATFEISNVWVERQ